MTRTASFVIKNPYMKVHNVDISEMVREVEVNREYAEVDDTSSGDGNEHNAQGIGSGSFVATLRQSFATANLDDLLEQIFSTGIDVEVVVAPSGSTLSDTNPGWSALCSLRKYTPFSGKIGDLVEVKAEFKAQEEIARTLT